MKLAIINDTHWGARSDNLVFLDYTKRFLDDIFFPYIDKHEIQYVFHLGDLVERRKYINFNTANRLRRDFLLPLQQRQLAVAILAGNHDVYYKDTNEVNALRELVVGKYAYMKVFSNVAEVEIDGVPILLIPWITADNRDNTLNAIENTRAQICFGHLDLNGFEMYRGVVQRDGEDPKIFSKFDIVLTGHYHHKSSGRNVNYLGAPLQFDWHDYNDPKGFHIFDTDTRELVFIENPYVIFKKLWYNDKGKTIDEVINSFDFSKYAGCFCKLIVQEKMNPYWFDLFVERLEKENLSNLQIVEDHMNLDLESDSEIVSEAEDTFTIFKRAIEQIDNIDRDGLLNIISELYQEALTID